MQPDTTITRILETASAPGTATIVGGGPGPAPSPKTFAKYELLDAFPGGMATVFRARHTVLGCIRALKRLKFDVPRTEAERQRFETEAATLAHLKHPHIINVIEYGEEHGCPYFTMDFIEGGSLAKRLDEFAGQPARVAALMETIALAVHYAHMQGVLHRDLKPGNVLLRSDDDPVVADFGLAKILDADAGVTHSNQLIGTPAYMSPEQLRGESRTLGPASDVWTLGVILHELLTGKRPFPGSSREDVTPQVLLDDPPTPSEVSSAVPRELDNVVLRCLAKKPRDRYASAEELADTLADWQAGKRLKDRRPVTQRALRRRRRAWTAALACALTLGGLLLGSTWRPSFLRPIPPSPAPTATERLAAEYAERGKLDLLGASGPMRHHRAATANLELIDDTGDGSFGVKCRGVGLLELMNAPDHDGFVFRAELLHEASDKGAVGIYMGHELFPPGHADWHTYLQLRFADVGDLARDHTGRPELRVRLECEYAKGESPTGASSMPVARLSLKPARQWRTLEIRDDGAAITATFDGQRVGSVLRTVLMKEAENFARSRRPALDRVTPTYPTRGSIGLCVTESTARVRNLTLEKLMP